MTARSDAMLSSTLRRHTLPHVQKKMYFNGMVCIACLIAVLVDGFQMKVSESMIKYSRSLLTPFAPSQNTLSLFRTRETPCTRHTTMPQPACSIDILIPEQRPQRDIFRVSHRMPRLYLTDSYGWSNTRMMSSCICGCSENLQDLNKKKCAP